MNYQHFDDKREIEINPEKVIEREPEFIKENEDKSSVSKNNSDNQ